MTMASKKKRKPSGPGLARPSLSREVCDQLDQHLLKMQKAASSSELSEEERRRAMLQALASFTQVHFDLKGEPMPPEIQDALGIAPD